MDIKHAPGETLHETRGQNAHEARQHHQVRLVAFDYLDQGAIVSLAALIFGVGQHHSVDAGVAGALQAVNVRHVGDDGNNLAA